jgi:alkyl hydroperoxide reductase subunit AhpC/predicted Ser/Thr protein kinase
LDCVDAAGATRRAALADYAGQWLILIFYPRDFSFVCPTELTAFSARIADFESRRCALLGISVDTLDMHREWLGTPPRDGGIGPLRYPLASDSDGRTARAYGAWDAEKEVCTRGLFIIDPAGVLQYSVIHNLSVGRNTDEVLRVLDALQTGGLCPASWTLADGTLDPEAALRPGRVLGHYRIRRQLGTGSFGNVFEACDLRLERPVALKVLKRYAAESRQALLHEARAAARLNHPHVCTIYSVDEEEGLPVIVMELLDGRPLSETIAAGMEGRRVLEVARSMAAGMAAAHQAGIVHGDLKPANVMLTGDGRVKVLDFGLAGCRGMRGVAYGKHGGTKATEAEHGASADSTLIVAEQGDARGKGAPTLSGTPAYMSPEQASGSPATAASDVFSLGLVVYEMLTGRRALGDESPLQTVLALRTRDLAEELASGVGQAHRALVQAMLDRDPARRPSMADVAASLERIDAE